MALVFCEDNILTITTVNDKLTIPKGHLEGNETSIDAAIRECFEETGVILNLSDFVCEITKFNYEFIQKDVSYSVEGFDKRFNNAQKVKKNIIVNLFVIKNQQSPTIQEPHLIKETSWMNVHLFMSNSSYDNDKQAVKKALIILKKEK